ncbi:zinc finger MYM-type protein 1-like [Triplophysa rosa]|uniref:zinc finger MYM-type protein 1-like n=1 Tax=Triplophysa rosa TaxID=992332 RepID=UPI0025460D79|nr:zinc finger MYM-type protein 1-like [Triplophysa rosa]
MLALLWRSSITGSGTVNAKLVQQLEGEKRHWREVLKRVVAVITFLSERGLPFRGNDEVLGSPHNGNFLGILEVISQFDPFLAEHINKYGQKGRGSTSYLSSTICEDLIKQMGDKIKATIAAEIQQAKYFSVIVDSTPDLSHTDQLTFIFRFVSKEGKIIERFVDFEPIESHTGESLANTVMTLLDSFSLDIANCRGQEYDNASNMSGRYNGLQAHLKKKNPLIHYIPCAAHSLNLVGVNSIEGSCQDASKFFDLMQSLYAFCAGSTHRWNIFFNNANIKLDMTLKSLSSTRWSCRADASKALCGNYAKIREILPSISSDTGEKRDTRSEAAALCSKLGTLEAQFWHCILSRFKVTSESLQKADMELMTAIHLFESLRSWVVSLRDQFDHFETAAKNVPGVCQSYKDELQRVKKRKVFSDESTEHEVTLKGRERYQVETFNVIIDKLVSCLDHRVDA